MLRMKPVWKVLCIASLALLPALPAIAQTVLVEDVEIRGYTKVSLEEIKKRIRTEPGKPFDLEQAKGDLQRLLEMDVFDLLKSRLVVTDGPRKGKIVTFVLEEKT